MGLFLSLLVSLSLFFRITLVNVVPPELFGDEIDVGYQAYSLLKTGRDLYNQPFPVYLHSLSEWRAPLLMYATVPSLAVFGLNEWGVRLPEVFFGTLSPLILFLLVKEVSKSSRLAALSAIALALMPWHIQYSRAAFEVVLLIDLILLGTLSFFKNRYVLAAIFFALSFYTYSTSIVFVPLWLITLFLFQRKTHRPTFPSLVLFAVLCLPIFLQVVAGPARERFGLLSLTNNKDIVDKIMILRKESGPFWGKIMHNKVESYISVFSGHYLTAFSTDFLFVRGDPVYRQSIQIIGELWPISFPFLFMGLYLALRRREFLWLAWLLLAPIPSAMTSDGGYHATRLFLMTVPLAVFIGFGLYQLKKKIFIVFIGLVFAIQLTGTAYYYVVHYPKNSWRWWQVGYKDTLQHLAALSPNYSRVFINNTYEPSLIRFLFWTNYSPAKFHANFTLDQPQNNIVPNYDGFALDGKYFFGNFNKSNWYSSLLPNSLYLISQRDNVGGDWDWRKDPPGDIQVLHTTVNSYNEPIFYLVAKK